MKRKILFVYPEMMLGGSTSSLLSLMNTLDTQKYEIYLQLLRNTGPLMDVIPDHVHLLEPAEKNSRKAKKVWKKIKFFLSGYAFHAWRVADRRKILSRQILLDYTASMCSKAASEWYDYAVGGLEGWADRYIAYQVNSGRKICWLHSTIDKIAEDPQLELNWMRKVDKVVVVSQSCKEQLDMLLPEIREKSICLENIMDSATVRRRAEMIDSTDASYVGLCRCNKFKIISVCRLSMETKGLDRMVTCAARLKRTGFSFRWYVIGDGADGKAMRTMIEEYDVSDVLILLGKKINPYPFMKQCQIMCMPSRWEGMPITVTESKILGLVPVVTEYLSVHEQITDHLDGIIVPNEDDAIYYGVTELIEHPQLLEEIRETLLKNEYGNRDDICAIEKALFDDVEAVE